MEFNTDSEMWARQRVDVLLAARWGKATVAFIAIGSLLSSTATTSYENLGRQRLLLMLASAAGTLQRWQAQHSTRTVASAASWGQALITSPVQ
jgi:hypothetical protein